ncbi:MAG: hypothetical protein KF891_12725 [Rhizobacter sp.]|nr:hypothetical protein [Rhizobacter sp.]
MNAALPGRHPAALLVVAVTAALALSSKAFAFGALLQYEGEVDDRVAYFADLRYVLNKTPPAQMGGPVEFREIAVTAVYENASKPEFVHLKLQFQCPSWQMPDRGTFEGRDPRNAVRASDPVTFRIGPGSYALRRADLKTEPVTESDWKTSSAPMLAKAGIIACNDIEVDHALHAAIKGRDFDFDGFGKRIAKLGLPPDMAVIGHTLPSEVLEFAWENLWWRKVLEGKRPDPSGKWSTPLSEADRQAALARLRQKQEALASGTASLRSDLLESLRKTDAAMKADLEAAQNADKHPDGSKMNKYEARLAAVFRGQPEQKVVDLMGNPQFNQVGGTRFLRYTQYWEKPGVTVYGAQGVIGGDAGGYAECFAEFRVRQDAKGEWRVDDVLVRADYQGERGGSRVGSVCDDATRPRSGK